MDVIDAAWIKRHLTHRHGELKALADAVGLEPDKITKILKGTRQIKATEAPRIAAFFQQERPGFAEPVGEYRAQVVPVNATGRILALAAALCPELPKPDVYRVKHSAPAAGMLTGDLLVVQLGMTARPGDLVITTIADTARDVQTTLVRRYWPPLLVPLGSDDPFPALPADGDQAVAILATVKGAARGGIAS